MLTPKIVKSLRLWWTYALDPVRVMAMYWVEGVHSSQPMIWAVASPTPLQRRGLAFKSRKFSLAGTGIPEYSGDSGVIPDSGVQAMEVPVKKILRKKQESTGILRNPGQERKTGT